ncbi:MAG: hypothetical protein CMQ10_05080 [Gammaproteobacteria bacterium]|nr:hypothetical protein [Gammaproteobacteria bacterium]
MFDIDVSTLETVGEFGSKSWGEACAEFGIKILQSADLPDDLVWGFSETYTHAPQRLVGADRPIAGYYFMVNNGVISGGDGVPEECLGLPGFHAKLRWAYLCNQSRTLYGSAGQKQRGLDEAELVAQMEARLGYKPEMGGVPSPVWPKPIIVALSHGVESGGGLHNIAASLQAPSPEFEGWPTTELGVPNFSAMTEAQQLDFIALCGLESS